VSRKFTIGVGISVLLLAGAVVLAFIAGPPPPLVLPNPNGYDDFLAAARAVQTPVMRSNFSTTNFPIADLVADVASNG
jgi:hypothetical protein